MFPPGVRMNSEVDLAVESILMKEGAPDPHSAASPPPAATPEPLIRLISSPSMTPKESGLHFGIPLDEDSIQSATIPQELSAEKCPDLMEVEAAFPDNGSLCLPVLKKVSEWREAEEEEDGSQTPNSSSDDGPAECIAENLIREMIHSIAFDVHHITKIGLSFLFSDKESASEGPAEIGTRLRSPVKGKKSKEMIGGKPMVEPMKIHSNPLTDIFGQPLANSGKVIRGQECTCPQCGRAMAATRFAPHLEKCMGMGRNSSRLANRRIMQSSAWERPSSTGSSSSVRQRQTGASGSGASARATGGAEESEESEEASGDDDYEFDDRDVMDDDEDWLASSKRGKISRKKPVSKRAEKRASKLRNPLLGASVDLGPPKDDASIFHFNDLLDAPPMSQQVQDPVSLFDSAHFPGLHSSETPSPAGSETIVLRNRKVRKPKPEEVGSYGAPDLEMDTGMGSFDEDSRDAPSTRSKEEDKSPQVICLDDDDDEIL